MADPIRLQACVRFEVYIPAFYKTIELGADSGESRTVVHSVDRRLLRRFETETVERYHGLTQSNPVASPPYKGYWKKDITTPVEIDFLTVTSLLVKLTDENDALTYLD